MHADHMQSLAGAELRCGRDEAPGSLVLITSFVRAARDVFLGFPLEPPPTRVPPAAEVCAEGSAWRSCTLTRRGPHRQL